MNKKPEDSCYKIGFGPVYSVYSSVHFDAFDLPYVIDLQSQDYTFGKVLGSVCSDLSPPSDVIEAHRKQLKGNLAAFYLQIEEVVGDGDCAFTSIIKQLLKAVPNLTKEADNFIRSLLGLLKSEEQDTLVLRQMFGDRMLEPDKELREFIRNSDSDILRRNIEALRCPGFFNNEVGDFVMKAAIFQLIWSFSKSVCKEPITKAHLPNLSVGCDFSRNDLFIKHG